MSRDPRPHQHWVTKHSHTRPLLPFSPMAITDGEKSIQMANRGGKLPLPDLWIGQFDLKAEVKNGWCLHNTHIQGLFWKTVRKIPSHWAELCVLHLVIHIPCVIKRSQRWEYVLIPGNDQWLDYLVMGLKGKLLECQILYLVTFCVCVSVQEKNTFKK